MRINEFDLRNAIAEDLEAAIDAVEDTAHEEFIAGIEYATAIVLKSVDARPLEIQ